MPSVPHGPPTRVVHCTDGVQWLQQRQLLPTEAIFTSLPDHVEMKRLSAAQWRDWFTSTAELIVRRTARGGVAVFYQTDVKRDGLWIDKAYLVQRAAEAAAAHLLWHKIVCRAPAGTATFGRPGYAHLLCFAHERRDQLEASTADVLPELGAMTWPKAIGLAAADATVRWLRDHAGARCLVDPFCGVGTVLAVANRHGLDAIGVEIAPSRVERARRMTI